MKPFRWNLKKREQLGTLINIKPQEAYSNYFNDLRECSAKVIARSEDRKLIFVGRSPENLFDYLSGVLDDSPYEEKIDMLNISNRFHGINDIKNRLPESYQSLKEHFLELGIAPEQIISSPNGVCFCDLVYSGGTFERLFEFIYTWSQEEKCDVPSVIRKITFLGVIEKTKNSPNTWRWQQHASWLKKHPKLKTKNISVSCQFWSYLGDNQHKVSKTNAPKSWADNAIFLPPRETQNIAALRQAYDIYNLAKQQKKEFTQHFVSTHELKESWLRQLVDNLKTKSK